MYPNSFYRLSVKALIKDGYGRVLVLKENQNTWSLPGGGVDHGEDIEAALRRELQEELAISQLEIRGVKKICSFYLEPKQAWLLWVVYEVSIGNGVPKLGKGVTAVEYIDPGDLAKSEDIFEQQVVRASE